MMSLGYIFTNKLKTTTSDSFNANSFSSLFTNLISNLSQIQVIIKHDLTSMRWRVKIEVRKSGQQTDCSSKLEKNALFLAVSKTVLLYS